MSHELCGVSSVKWRIYLSVSRYTSLPLHFLPLYHWGSHYSDVIISAVASQITGVSIVCSTVCLGDAQRKVRRHWPLLRESTGDRWIPPVMRKMFTFDDVIIILWTYSRLCLSDYYLNQRWARRLDGLAMELWFYCVWKVQNDNN